MDNFLNHWFTFAESYAVILLWTAVPLAGLYGLYWCRKQWRTEEENTDAEDRRTA